jgi:hypothetical protein
MDLMRLGSLVLLIVCCAAIAWADGITKTDRGALVETNRYKATFLNGVLTGVVNKLTDEEYLDKYAKPEAYLPHLPSGLGTQNGAPALAAAEKLYHWPWWEHASTNTWPNQHYADGQSAFTFTEAKDGLVRLVYKNLTDGTTRFPDDTFTLELVIEKETGDLLVTPIAAAKNPGVYAANLTVAPLGPAITVEAPIFDGVQLDRHMQHMLWSNAWGGYWDYAFVALNGYKQGAVAIWTQDAEMKYYKNLFYLINPEGLSLSFSMMNVPPFDKLKEAKAAMPWRLQAYEKGWPQAVARFRDWRVKNVKFAPRPEWTKQVSFINGGVNASKSWVDYLEKYLGSTHLNRTVTFGAVIRGEGFDQNHSNNTPYKGFKDDMVYWKGKGPKMMAYLQPMIMWGARPVTDREKAAVALSAKANTVSVFQGPDAKSIAYVDQHHLGEKEWQRWFLDWVKEYIQDYGADGVYHDQSYHCPIDARGLAINGMTSTQGMADYFYKAATETQNAIHGTEHMTEVNNVGASLGIGSGILWGTAESMRKQRIDHPSPICNALHAPNGVIFAFPHYSQITSNELERIHWGMNLVEGRGDIAYAALQSADAAETKGLANERWLDYVRSMTFVNKGLRPVFPEDWDRIVLTYFKGANGEDVRYVKTAWGTAFVQVEKAQTTILYGRIHGTSYAQVAGAITGWPLYNANGPAGLHPNRYYTLDPNGTRPAVYFSTNNQFSPSLYEGYVDEGFATDAFAYISIKPRENLKSIIGYDSVILNSKEAPKAVFVNGAPTKANPAGEGKWKIDFQLREAIAIVALVKELPGGIDKLGEHAVGRAVGNDWAIDQKLPQVGMPSTKTGVNSGFRLVHVPLRAPADQGDGVMKLTLSGYRPLTLLVNGMGRQLVPSADGKVDTLALPMKAGDYCLLTLRGERGVTLACEWVPNAPPVAPPVK